MPVVVAHAHAVHNHQVHQAGGGRTQASSSNAPPGDRRRRQHAAVPVSAHLVEALDLQEHDPVGLQQLALGRRYAHGFQVPQPLVRARQSFAGWRASRLVFDDLMASALDQRQELRLLAARRIQRYAGAPLVGSQLVDRKRRLNLAQDQLTSEGPVRRRA